MEFLGRRSPGLLRNARSALADYLGTQADHLVYTTNVTVALNIVAHSLALGPGDEVLATDHEYGALDRTWQFLAAERGFHYVKQPIPLPLTNQDAFIETLWNGVCDHTRVLFLSHITSPTALVLPVEEVCARARREGIITIVDGAHAPGQIPLNLDALGVDFYGGNLHKWLCAPKGAGFLFARPDVQALLKPLVVSWGYEAETPGPSRFVDYHEMWGTRDIASFLSVPAAIEFQARNNWGQVQAACHALVRQARDEVSGLTGQAPISDDSWFAQMAAALLPPETDLQELKTRLYDEYRIEIPLINWNGQKLIRISIQGYNTRRDVDRLIHALQKCLGELNRGQPGQPTPAR